MPNDDKRARILAAATAVFAERDFHRVQVSDVAQRAGVGKGTLYLYFPTKDALLDVALRGNLERLAEEMEAAAAADVAGDAALRAIVLAILRFFWKRPDLLTVVQRYERALGGSRRQEARRNRALHALEHVLARHRIGAGGAERHLNGAYLIGMARAAILHHAAGDRPEAAAGRIVRLFLHGVGAVPAARRTPGARRKEPRTRTRGVA